ncbi:MAG: hypothetical protein QOI98_1934, partial [Solirubrobacteraceae bacterium]|nr:hypothetical protein [Solirubrobacteraceae bacterium]
MSGPLEALRRRVDIVPAKHHARPVLIGFVVIGLTMLAIVSAAT